MEQQTQEMIRKKHEEERKEDQSAYLNEEQKAGQLNLVEQHKVTS